MVFEKRFSNKVEVKLNISDDHVSAPLLIMTQATETTNQPTETTNEPETKPENDTKPEEQCWCGVVHLTKMWTARIFYQNATAKTYRTFFRLFD